MASIEEIQENESLTLGNLNPSILWVTDAVRGPTVLRASEIEQQLKNKPNTFPFLQVIRANIGDPHASANQLPITYIRQFVAGCSYPCLMNMTDFPLDIKQRVERLLNACSGKSLGSYTESQGILTVRKDIADYIERRDGYPANPNDIYLSNGATEGIRLVLKLLMNNDRNKPSGIMIPVPQYSLYSDTLSLYGAYQIRYYLDEENHWALNLDELRRAFDEAKEHCIPRGIVVINPGNPTGQVLSSENIRMVIQFAYQHKLFILADEVYQENIYFSEFPFCSFKKVLMDLGSPYNRMQMASFHSASKGWHGECGSRGAYYELINLSTDVRRQVNKLVSAGICSTSWGQVVMDAIINPPKEGEPSYELYKKERSDVLNRLKEKANLVTDLFNSVRGVRCNKVMGAMYAFPRIDIPEKAIAYATSVNMTPDTFYCFQLLEKTGICVIPGSGFQQKPNTYHFRITILSPTNEMRQVVDQFRTFHESFLCEWQ